MKMKSLLLVTIATLGLTASTMAQNLPNYVPSNGLVGWWPFNGNANDESGNGSNGQVNGATLSSDRFGQSGKAYSFDGIDDYINIGNGNYGNNMSISLWIKENYKTQPNYIISKYDGNALPFPDNSISRSWILYRHSQAEQFKYCFQISADGVAAPNLFFTEVMDTSQWRQLVVVFNSGQINYYVDGAIDTSFNSAINSFFQSNTPILIGTEAQINEAVTPGLNSGYFDGEIDDIGIWNRALSQQEITDLYNANICYQTITVTDTLLINMGIVTYNPITYNNTIKIFPNPANNHITIDYGNFATLNGYQLKIENSLGQQLFQTNITQQTDYLSLNNWGGNGLYFVHIIDSQGNTIDIRKIVLQ